MIQKMPERMHMVTEHEKNRLREWARENPQILALYVFGSRAKGTASSESDIDIAVTVLPSPGDEDPVATYIFEGSDWQEFLERCLPYPVHLELYDGPTNTPHIHEYLEQGNICLFRRECPEHTCGPMNCP